MESAVIDTELNRVNGYYCINTGPLPHDINSHILMNRKPFIYVGLKSVTPNLAHVLCDGL